MDHDSAELLGYTVLPWHSTLIAIPSGGVRLGEGVATFMCGVSHVVDMGHHRHLVGSVGKSRVDVRLAPSVTPPDPGTVVAIGADAFVPLADRGS